jgi:hypothetical protein
MHAIGKKTPSPRSAPTELPALAQANRVPARARPKPRSTCPTLSIVPLKPGPLTRLAWLFLHTDR